jgi:hypothetical protein
MNYIPSNLEDIKESPISDALIKQYLPDANIIMYNQLPRYKNIEELLPHDKSYFVLMYQDSPNTGHWTVVLRQKNTVEYFDSYGSYPDKDLNWVSKEKRHSLGIDGKYLSNLFNKTKLKVVYNTEPYQASGKEIATCGRHVVFRIMNINKGLLNYHKFIKNQMKKQNCNYDCVVSKVIPEVE